MMNTKKNNDTSAQTGILHVRMTMIDHNDVEIRALNKDGQLEIRYANKFCFLSFFKRNNLGHPFLIQGRLFNFTEHFLETIISLTEDVNSEENTNKLVALLHLAHKVNFDVLKLEEETVKRIGVKKTVEVLTEFSADDIVLICTTENIKQRVTQLFSLPTEIVEENFQTVNEVYRRAHEGREIDISKYLRPMFHAQPSPTRDIWAGTRYQNPQSVETITKWNALRPPKTRSRQGIWIRQAQQ